MIRCLSFVSALTALFAIPAKADSFREPVREWTLTYSETIDGSQSTPITASVPGCVQIDWGKAFDIPSYHEGNNVIRYYGLEDRFWHYFTTIKVARGREVPYLCLDGVEYEYDVLIDGKTVLSHEGMFTRVRIDLSEYKGKEVPVEIRIHPAPKVEGTEPVPGIGNESAESCKPAFSYGWDWCPRFITLGIVDEVYVEYRPHIHITDWDLSYRLDNNCSSADIAIDYSVSGPCSLKAELFAPGGDSVCSEIFNTEGEASKHITLQNPELWWPHNHGSQPVYKLQLSVLKDGKVTETLSRNISFRQVKMVANAGVRADGVDVSIPATLQINGRKIFAKGSNWVPSEMCRSMVDPERIRTLLTYLKECNMNILRLWGGSYIQPDWFYDMCDEIGIMIWQEFPLSCAAYSEDKPYLDILAQESEAIIKQLRTHACLVLWCGGNELFCSWSAGKWGSMSYQSKALRLLDSQTLAYDPDTPYWHTSPQHGIRHGGYRVIDGDGELVTQVYQSDYLGYTEFGCGSISEYDYIKQIVSGEDLAKPMETDVWTTRHAHRWGDFAILEKVTGRDYSHDFIKGTEDSNEVQGNCYRSVFELARQKWPHTSLAINWCYNEPWATLAGNGLVNYPDHRRPSYYKVKEALRPTLLSVAYRSLRWHPGDTITLDTFLLNDSGNIIAPGEARLEVYADGELIQHLDWAYPETMSWSNSKGSASLEVIAPETLSGEITIKAVSNNHPEWNSEYVLYVK